MSGPKFDLTEVKALAHDYLEAGKALDGQATIRFTAPRRSTEAVVAVFQCSPNSANRKIAMGLLGLEEKDFLRRTWQWNDVFDEYGLENFEGHNWYIKYCVVKEDSKYIEEVSFHPLEKEMVLPDGRVLKITYGPSVEKG